MGLRGGYTGDWHYGLSVEDLDRSPEVDKAAHFMVDWALKEKLDFFSIGGDCTDTNYPLPDHISLLMRVLNRFEAAKMHVFFLMGNHESLADAERMWALTPLENVGYKYIHFITKPMSMTFKGHDFLFLPHVTKATAIKEGFSDVQEYLDKEAKDLLSESKTCTVISHYNVNGARAGTEAMRLRQTDLQLPACILTSKKVLAIFNSHIHSPQLYKGKIHMPGSPICTDFGDVDENKGFIYGELEDDGWKVERVKTPQAPLMEFELTVDEINEKYRKMVKKCAEAVLPDAIVKIKVLINEETLPQLDEEWLREQFVKTGAKYVKKVSRVIQRKKSIRDVNQKPNLAAPDAVKTYLQLRKPDGQARKEKLALAIITGEGVEQHSEAVFKSHAVSDDLVEKVAKDLPNLDDMDLDFDFDSDFQLSRD